MPPLTVAVKEVAAAGWPGPLAARGDGAGAAGDCERCMMEVVGSNQIVVLVEYFHLHHRRDGATRHGVARLDAEAQVVHADGVDGKATGVGFSGCAFCE